MEGATPTQHTLHPPVFQYCCGFIKCPRAVLNGDITQRVCVSTVNGHVELRADTISGSEALILLSLVLECTRQRESVSRSGIVRSVYRVNDGSYFVRRSGWTRNARGLAVAVTGSHPVLLTDHNYPLIRCRALVNAVMNLRVP
jgi:hypothetical protein